jgi:beta-barrel assembly-enhancing protease
MNAHTCTFCRRLPILMALLSLFALSAAQAGKDQNSREISIGKEAAEDIEREVKLVTDATVQSRIDTIGKKIAAVAKVTVVPATYGTPDLANFNYTFKVIDVKDINAFALPGGFIYVNKGLVDYVESEDELAAVLAHEIAHVAHHHTMKLVKKQTKMDGYIALLVLLGSMGNLPNRDLNNLIYGAQLVRTSKMGGYGQTAELDADRTAVTYLQKAGYDPSALLTFLHRMSTDVENKPQLPMGIFRTHPPYQERADNLIAEFDVQQVKYDTTVTPNNRVAFVRLALVNGTEVGEVALAGKTLFQPADTPASTSAQRAAAIANNLNSIFESCAKLKDAKVTTNTNCVRINGDSVVEVTPEDTQLHNAKPEQLVRRAIDTLRFAVWCEWVKDQRLVSAAQSENQQTHL